MSGNSQNAVGQKSLALLKTSVVSLAVLLALSSCGKNKELNTPPDAKPATETPAADTGTVEGGEVKADEPKDSNVIEVKEDENDFGIEDGSNDQADGRDQDDFGSDDRGDEDRPTRPGRGGGRNNDDRPMPEPKPRKAASKKLTDINFKAIVADKTGGKSKDLFYTGAGQDGLMADFKRRSSTVSEAQQKMNANLAKAVVGARLSHGESATLDLAIDESLNGQGSVKNYRLKGTPADGMLKLSLASTNGDLEFQGGFLKCLDLDGGCKNSYAKIKLSGAYTRVIFRKSNADSYFMYQENITNNPGFDGLKHYILNTVSGARSTQVIDNVEVSSFEVTNGRGGMGAAITTMDNEMIGLNIPLLVSGTASLVDTAVVKASDISKSYDLNSSAGYSSRLSQAITDVKLVGNTGAGQLKVKLNYAAGANSGAIWIIMSKIQRATISLEQVAAFEASVKNF